MKIEFFCFFVFFFTNFLKDKTRATVNFLMCSVISPMVLKYKVQ